MIPQHLRYTCLRPPALVVSLALLVCGCAAERSTGDDGGDDQGNITSGLTYHKDIAPIVSERCAVCHTTDGIAPFVMDTFQDVTSIKAAVRSAVLDTRMPPWPPNNDCAEYKYDRSLSQAQINAIVSWIDDGAPEGDPADAQQKKKTSSVVRADVVARMPETYTPTKSPDDYRCFLIEWPESTTKYITGINVKPGNAKLVHHVIAFLAGPSQVDEYRALDAAEPGPGYTCFGGPGGDIANGFGWAGAWAPGGQGEAYPQGTGIRIEPGSLVIMQVHYNTLTNATETDQSEIEFMVEDGVDQEAIIVPYLDLGWIAFDTMKIPAGATDVMHETQLDPTRLFENKPVTMHAVATHQHTLGTSNRIDIYRNGVKADAECALDIPKWDFNWQGSYTFKQAKVVNPGDILHMECHWDNSPANQQVVDGKKLAPRDVSWGDGTTDEMCLGIFYVTSEGKFGLPF